MKAQDVIKIAVQYIGEKELLNTSTLGGQTAPTEEQTEKINNLFSCVNDTVQTLALMYFPLKYEQKITSHTGVYNFSTLQKPIVDIVKLTDEHKLDVEFAFFPTFFEAKAGTLNIVYTYMPDYNLTIYQTLDVAQNYVSERILAMGTVSKYYLYLGMYNDAEEWNKMFEQACLVAKRRKDNVVMRKRRWL